MALDLQEQEQVAQFRMHWQKWGKYAFFVFCCTVLFYLGYQGRQAYLTYQSKKISTFFIELDRNKDNPQKTLHIYKEIIAQYPRSAYAPRAALMVAKLEADSNRSEAKNQLLWVITHAKEASLRDIARLRLAVLHLNDKQYSQGLDQLKLPENEGYGIQFQEMKGDILVAMGKSKEAIEAYKQALAKIKDDVTYRMILEVKLDALENK
jgi:predicted negative regulator of RcsB-dependent stress response